MHTFTVHSDFSQGPDALIFFQLWCCREFEEAGVDSVAIQLTSVPALYQQSVRKYMYKLLIEDTLQEESDFYKESYWEVLVMKKIAREWSNDMNQLANFEYASEVKGLVSAVKRIESGAVDEDEHPDRSDEYTSVYASFLETDDDYEVKKWESLVNEHTLSAFLETGVCMLHRCVCE